MFTWKQIYTELATALLAWRSRQSELIAILHAAKEQGVPVSTLQDEDKNGKKFPLEVIDPFTFFGFFNRGIKKEHRLTLLSAIKDKLALTSPLPDDFEGIPVMFPQRTWFFSYQADRKSSDIDTLWDFAKAIVEQSPETVDGQLFAHTLALPQVGLANLTMGMFWMRPDNYLAVDKRNRALLKKSGIEPDISDWPSYLNLLKQAKEQSLAPSWAELSLKAYRGDIGGGESGTKRHWLFQAKPTQFDLIGALKAGALGTWQAKQHRKEIHLGDRVVLWLSGNDAGVYGLATVTSEVGEIQESPEEAAFQVPPTGSTEPFIGVTLTVDSNFSDSPITKEEMLKHKHTKSAPMGRQGTNFPLTEKQFNAIASMTPAKNEGRRYWLYAPGEHARFWNECQEKKLMLVGYDELDDFRKFKSQLEIEQTLKKIRKLKQRPYNQSRAIWEFANVVKPGDVVIAKKGRSEYLGYGIVAGPYRPDASRPEYKHVRSITWVKKGSWKADFKLTLKTLTDVTKYPDYVVKLKKLIGIADESQSPIPTGPFDSALNIILYGPPGTGKTYKTIERAVQIIEPNFNGDHAAYKARFDVLRKQGQIEFITFHQSYSYEDFVEGLRPVLDGPESSEAAYEYCSGVFKRFALRALFDCLKPTEITDPFDAVWKKLVDQIDREPDKQYPGLTDKTSYRVSLSARDNLEGVNTLSNKTFLCSRSVLKQVFTARHTSKTISSTDVMEVVVRGCHSHFVAAMFNELKRIEGSGQTGKSQASIQAFGPVQKENVAQAFLEKNDTTPAALKPPGECPRYVLVVDEINRGNISKILGELITLIEADKRLGTENAMVVTLPYTKHSFAVPANLHVLGTMNTADKSIALVDVALRRRFEFEELRPNFDHCQQLTKQMRDLLDTLNRRICLRKDRDHQIGHSYFMKVADESGFNRVFARQIIPLLQEYFYNDWDGLQFVLGVKNKPNALIIPLKDGDTGDSRSSWQWGFDPAKTDLNFLQILAPKHQPA